MLNVIIHRKLQFTAAIALAFLVAAATVWPMRLYTEDHTYLSGLNIDSVSEEVTEDLDAGNYFIAQYDHLQTLEFYVASVTSGTEAYFQLFHRTESGGLELVAEETVELPDEVPGYASVSVDADMEFGDTYVFTLCGVDGSRFTVGFESMEEALATGTSPLYSSGFYNDTTKEGLAVQMRLTYRVELSKWPSLVLVVAFLLLALAAGALVGRYYKARPERNAEVTVLQALQRIFTPVTLAVGAAAFIAVWPMKLFDSRLPDILVYETGIVLAVLLILYALWHDRSGVKSVLSIHHLRRNVWHYFIIFCIALIMSCSADYMNATSDLQHAVSMNLIAGLLCMIIYMMGDAKANLNAWVSRVFVIGTIAAVIWYFVNRVPASEADAQMLNAILRTRAFACVMAAIALTATVVTVVQRRLSASRPDAGISKPLIAAVGILAVMLLVFRNTRQWIPLMIGIWAMFYIRYRYWSGRLRLLQDLCEGIVLDFLFKVAYTMLHRYYMAYRFSRFSMHFHTVTVTAYYLTIVAAAALTLFVWKYRESAGMRFKERMAHLWKEAFLLGLVGAYMLMTLTRSGIGAFAILVVIAAIACALPLPGRHDAALPCGGAAAPEKEAGGTAPAQAGVSMKETAGPAAKTPMHTAGAAGASRETAGTGETAPAAGRGAFGRAFRALCAMALTVLLTFPLAFTGQRLISTVYAHPERFEDLETYDDWLVRNVTWNCTRFMNIEIFLRDFGDRVIGGELGSALYYGMGWEEAQTYRTSELDSASDVLYEEVGQLASANETAAGLLLTSADETAAGLLLTSDRNGYNEGLLESGDASNGRVAMYIAYLQNLNLTGHDVMWLTMENGETTTHAHNIILQVAYDCGVPTGLIFLAVLVLLFAASYRYALKVRTDDPAEKDEAGGDYRRSRYALMSFLLMTGFCVIGMVEWIFHFSNPFTIAVLFARAPVLFPERE